MPALLSLALSTGIALAASTAPDAPAADRACPGPRVDEVAAELAQRDRFAFEGTLRGPFLALWRDAQRPPLPVEPDRVTVLATPGEPLIILFGRVGCALAMLRASRPEVFQALRAGVGPAV